MKVNIKKNIKSIIITLIMLFITFCVYGGIIHKIVLARADYERDDGISFWSMSGWYSTERSKARPTNDIDWINWINNLPNESVFKDPGIGESLFDIINREHPDQVRDDGIYVSYQDLLQYSSLFCNAHGVLIPERTTDERQMWTKEQIMALAASGSVTGAYSVPSDYTDHWYTLGKYTLKERRQTTPAEAWVLSEFNENEFPDNIQMVPTTNYVYASDLVAMGATVKDYNGQNIVIAGQHGSEKYYIQGEYEWSDDYTTGDWKYYELSFIGGKGDEIIYYPFTYVQHAWWKESKDNKNADDGFKDTDLAREAEDFENYIAEVQFGKGSNPASIGRDDWKRNTEENFDIDYKVGFDDAIKYQTRFDAESNKYIIGPFKLNYSRCVTKQGNRDKVSFCGISNSLIVGTDADGNELLQNGESVLQLGKNYKFLYDHDHMAELNAADIVNGVDAYGYPMPNEEFYIAIDYLDDLAKIKNIKFEFQYMTAGGSYEVFEGIYYDVTVYYTFTVTACYPVPDDEEDEEEPTEEQGEEEDGKGAVPDSNLGASIGSNDAEPSENIDVGKPDIDIYIDVVGGQDPPGNPFTVPSPPSPPSPPDPGPGPDEPDPGPGPGPDDPDPDDPDPDEPDPGPVYLYDYDWEVKPVITECISQELINAIDIHKVIDIGDVELEIIPEDEEVIDLRTSIGGYVWIDKDEQKDEANSGKLGIFDEGIDERAPENSVEVIVWKVEYDANGNEVGREKAVGWMDDGNNNGDNNDNSYLLPPYEISTEYLTEDNTEESNDDLRLGTDKPWFEDNKIKVPIMGDVGNTFYVNSKFNFLDVQNLKSEQSKATINIKKFSELFDDAPEGYENYNRYLLLEIDRNTTPGVVEEELSCDVKFESYDANIYDATSRVTIKLRYENKLVNNSGNGATKIDFENNKLFIDENGEYLIPRIQVPSKENKAPGHIFAYDVEFIYDGQTYETTEYLRPKSEDKEVENSNKEVLIREKLEAFKKEWQETAGVAKDYEDYADSSYVVENAEERKEFDSYFTEVYGKDSINNDGVTNGQASGGPGGIYYEPDRQSNDDTATELNYTSELYTEGEYSKTISTLVTHDDEGYILPQYRFASRISETGLVLPYEKQYHVAKENYDNLYFTQIAPAVYKPVDEYVHQINMGLLERYHSDASMLKDLYSAKIIVNNQESPTITFNSLAPLTEEALHQQVKPGYREQTYRIDLYNSDYKYRSSVYDSISDNITKEVLGVIKDRTELRLFVTYKLSIKNESVNTDMSINEFKDYYDKTFTLVDEDLKVNVEATDKEQSEQSVDDKKHGPDIAVYPKKTVAYAPYYRKLSADGAASDYSKLYMWNKSEDLQSPGIDLNNNGEKATGDITFDVFNTGIDSFHGSVSGSLRGVNADGSIDETMLLEPGESFEIFVTYEVDKEGFDQIQANGGSGVDRDNTLLGKKNNIAEITNYSTVYTDESVARHNTTRYEAGQISGRVDQDSAPDNININEVNATDETISVRNWEDDTETAPKLEITVKDPTARSLDGIVWEDKKTETSADGDGYFNPADGEEGIKDIDVTLVEKIRVTTEDLENAVNDGKKLPGTIADLNMLDYEFEFIWPEDGPGKLDDLDTTISTGEGGKYEFHNFVSGDYAVRFEYGNNEKTLKYNGQDYKMTAYQADMKNATLPDAENTVTGTSDMMERPGMPTLNNEWHDLSSNDNAKILENAWVSDARDYEPRRMKVMAYSRTITNENAEVLASYINNKADTKLDNDYKDILENNKDELIKNTAMVANTAKFKVDIEKQDTIAYKTVKTTKGQAGIKNNPLIKGDSIETDESYHEYEIANIDFGLVERPETRLYIKKELARIDLFKNDGSEVILSVECDEDGNLIKTNENDGLDGNVHIDKISEIEKANLTTGTQGFKYVAIESNFLAGMDVNLAYKMTIYNDSETDYVGVVLSEIKNVQRLYDKVADYETSEGDNGVPFNTGKDIQYGKYVGLHYYTNNVSPDSGQTYAGETYRPDKVVTTTVDQIVDYVDNDISLNLEETQNVEDQSWTMTSPEDRLHKLSVVSYSENNRDDENLVDNKGRKYIGNTSRNNIAMSDNELVELTEVTYVKTKTVNQNGIEVPVTEKPGGVLKPQTEDVTLTNVYSAKENISSTDISMYNPGLTRELKPGESASIMIATSAHANAEDSKGMNYDNLAEIVMYSNTVGRRDMQAIPGNANMIAKYNPAWQAGYTIDYPRKYNDKSTGAYIKEADYFTPNNTKVEVGSGATETTETIETERDAFAARDTVTFSEPTGLSVAREKIDMTVRLILLSLIASAIVVVTIIILYNLKKTTYDDKKLFNKE